MIVWTYEDLVNLPTLTPDQLKAQPIAVQLLRYAMDNYDKGFDGVVECMNPTEIESQYVQPGDTYTQALARMVEFEGIYNDYAEDIRNA